MFSSLNLTPCCYISLPCIMRFDINARMAPIAFVYHTTSYTRSCVTSPWFFPHQWFNFNAMDSLESLCVGSSTLCLWVTSCLPWEWLTQLAPNSQPPQRNMIIDKVVLLSLLTIFVLLSCSMSNWWNHKLCLGVVHNLMLTSRLPT